MLEFQDREGVLAELCALAQDGLLLNLFGEKGIGKSRVLQEAERKLQVEKPPAFVLRIDLEELENITDRPTAVLRAIIEQAAGRIRGIWESNEQVAAVIVAQLAELTRHIPVYVMFDTTEVLQGDSAFWDWLHRNLTEPLVVDGRVKQIYAGRIPVPWRRFELRRTVKFLPLGPITPTAASRALVEEALLQSNPRLKNVEDLHLAINIVLEFSFSHPLLSETLAAYVAQHWPPAQPLTQFKTTLCEQGVRKFINESLFKDVEAQWIHILWWASALDWFDPTILKEYLKHVMPELDEKPDYYFIQEIAELRKHNRIIWQESQGDRLHGLIQDIVRQCLKTMDPDRYEYACAAAAETFEAIAGEFAEEDSYAQQFRNEAGGYRRRLQEFEEAKQ